MFFNGHLSLKRPSKCPIRFYGLSRNREKQTKPSFLKQGSVKPGLSYLPNKRPKILSKIFTDPLLTSPAPTSAPYPSDPPNSTDIPDTALPLGSDLTATERTKAKPVKLFGLNQQMRIVREFFHSSPKQILVLHGKPGTGKSSTIQNIASEENFFVVEINSSDDRTYKSTMTTLQKIWMNQKNFGRRKLLVFEELDGGFVHSDGKSPVTAIKDFFEKIPNQNFKIVVTCNNVYDLFIKQKLQKLAVFVAYKPLSEPTMLSIVHDLQKRFPERGTLDSTQARELITVAAGDARQLLHNFEFSTSGLSGRDKTSTLFESANQYLNGSLPPGTHLDAFAQALVFTNYAEHSNMDQAAANADIFSLVDSCASLQLTDITMELSRKPSTTQFLKSVHHNHFYEKRGKPKSNICSFKYEK